MENNVIPMVITLFMAFYVVCVVIKRFFLQNKEPQIPCMIQYICDDRDYSFNQTRNAVMEKETKENELDQRQREYREWVENCNRLFRNNDMVA